MARSNGSWMCGDGVRTSALPRAWRELDGEQLAAAILEVHTQGAVLRDTRGRRTTAVEVDGKRLVVKYFCGDEPRDWWYERLRGAPRDPAEREARVLLAARSMGVCVPMPIAWLAEGAAVFRVPRPGLGWRALLVLNWVEHDQDLRRALVRADAAERRRLVDAVVATTAALHCAGLYHRDLYAPHFVIERTTRKLVLLDLGRTRLERAPRRRWFVKDLAALHATLPAEVGRAQRWRALLEWHKRVLGSCVDVRRTARAVDTKARALLAHRPIDVGTDRAGWPHEVGA